VKADKDKTIHYLFREGEKKKSKIKAKYVFLKSHQIDITFKGAIRNILKK